MLFETPQNQQPKAGKLLISEPYMGDENFERTVILLCEHNDKGSFGLVLNQKTQLTLSDVIDNNYSEQPIFTGGPVQQNTLHFLHRLGKDVINTSKVADNIYWGGDFEQIKSMLNYKSGETSAVKLFVGYSGWEAGQLQLELARNSWYITNADASLIFDTPPKDVWRSVLRQMGGNYKVISNYPTDPRLN